MKKSGRRISKEAIGLAGGIALTMSMTTAALSEQLKLALFVPFKNAYYAQTIASTQSIVKEAAGTVEVFDAGSDAQQQARQIQDATVSTRFNAFMIVPFDGGGVVPFVKAAADAGIKVAIDTTVVGTDLKTEKIQVPGVVSSATNPPYHDGRSIGENVVEACKNINPCKAIYLAGKFSFGYDSGVRTGVEEVLKSHPNIKIVSMVEGNYLADTAFKTMRDAFLANPDVNVVFSTSDTMIAGAVKAAKASGLTLGEGGIKLVGNGGSEIAAQGIKDGTWYSSLIWMPTSSAQFNIKNLEAAVNGKPLPGEAAIYTPKALSPVGLFIDKTNVDKFKPEYQGS
ncbi:sugar ABC transporter substrate-binding protein [Mesorhizobium sp. CA8]|uniref:sugar ABC transporter substrate-binding protein n=1 Tax=unclassified Mesorhizobium TaxID=325217 RepID=UPI001CCF4FA8|nr:MULTISPECIES: sugar ABC transporter substrate-binding protein [unclassified Mesorhizobium]MBZ9761701.1 sugar ABC transporter substrate-binding protein [Mesorhizobium sp. CA8]MBZ9820545.1 sugar ABC transporter substrate-binding protein [Mesorhizobium sp. CA4]